MSPVSVKREAMSRVLAHVKFVSWAPSQNGQINATEKTGMGVSVWVNHPLDERYPVGKKGGDEAVSTVRGMVEAGKEEWLGLLEVSLDLNMREDSIANQPKPTADLSDLGLRPPSSDLAAGPTRIIT